MDRTHRREDSIKMNFKKEKECLEWINVAWKRNNLRVLVNVITIFRLGFYTRALLRWL
jgi:hypothetical protein